MCCSYFVGGMDIMPEILPWVEMYDETYAYDNDLEIPTLDLAWQAYGIIGKFRIWGKHARKRPVPGDTYAFYGWDKHFTALIKHPEGILHSKCAAIVEPNFSTSNTMPLPCGIWGVYLKRKIARYVQTRGIRVIVDLNVAEKMQGINLMGVPQGWSSFAQRAHRQKTPADIEASFAYALETTQPSAAPYLVVYGGGEQMKKICYTHHWTWIPEHMTQVKHG